MHTKFEGRSFIRLRNIGTFRCGALIDPVTLTFDLLTLKSVWESHVTWGTPVQSFVFLGLLVLELEPMYATSDRRTTDADHRLMPPPPPLTGRGHNNRPVKRLTLWPEARCIKERSSDLRLSCGALLNAP